MTDILDLQAELDALGPPRDHFTAIRRQGAEYGGSTTAALCICGYFRLIASFDMAIKVAQHHERTGEEV